MCGSWPEPPGKIVFEAIEPSWQSSPRIRRLISKSVGCWTFNNKKILTGLRVKIDSSL